MRADIRRYGAWGRLMDLGFLARMLLGGLAGLAVLYWSVPERGVQLVALSVLAGVTGIALFRAFQARLVAAIEAARLGAAREAHAAILERVEAALEQEAVAIQEAAVAEEADERPRAREMLHEIRGIAEVGLRSTSATRNGAEGK